MYKEKDVEYSNYVIDFMKKFAEMYNAKPDYLYIVDVDVNESIKRRMATGEPVTFSKKDFLINYKKEFEKFYKTIDSRFYIDSTNLTEQEVANIVFNTLMKIQ